MTKSITPEEAFNAAKVIFPTMTKIVRIGNDFVASNQDNYEAGTVEIDWGSLTEWPPIPKPEPEIEYREPTPADIGKMVDVRDHDYQCWRSRKLIAVFPSDIQARFLVESLTGEKEFVGWQQARIAVEPTPKKPTRRPAKMPEDYGKRAWFRDDGEIWTKGVLAGHCHEEPAWLSRMGNRWKFCEVEE